MVEKIDGGSDIPPNIEMKFTTTMKKGNEQNEVGSVDFRINMHQIMHSGLEATLSSLLSLSYAAGFNNAEKMQKIKEKNVKQEAGKTKPGEAAEAERALNEIRINLSKRNIQTSVIKTGQLVTLAVILPEQQKQFSIIKTGDVYQITETQKEKPAQTIEKRFSTPAEVTDYIETQTRQ
jgi:hypothetical protein